MAISDSDLYLLNHMNSTSIKVGLGDLIRAAESVVAGEVALSSGHLLVGNASNIGVDVAASGDVTLANTGAFTIGAGAIVDSKVGASAAIAYSKLAALTSGNILVGSAGNVATSVAMSGDVTIIASGATTIANLAVTDAKVSASAAIAYSKLASLTSGNILVGSAGNVATSVAMSGDVTIIASGATTIGAAKVTVAKLDPAVMLEANTNLSQAQLQALSTPVQLVAAPSAGQIIIVDEIELLHTFSTAVYATGGNLSVRYNTSGTVVTLIASSFVTGGSSSNKVIHPSSYDLDATTGTGAGLDVTSSAGKALEITSSNFTLGNVANVVKIRVRYHIVTLLT